MLSQDKYTSGELVEFMVNEFRFALNKHFPNPSLAFRGVTFDLTATVLFAGRDNEAEYTVETQNKMGDLNEPEPAIVLNVVGEKRKPGRPPSVNRVVEPVESVHRGDAGTAAVIANN